MYEVSKTAIMQRK